MSRFLQSVYVNIHLLPTATTFGSTTFGNSSKIFTTPHKKLPIHITDFVWKVGNFFAISRYKTWLKALE